MFPSTKFQDPGAFWLHNYQRRAPPSQERAQHGGNTGMAPELLPGAPHSDLQDLAPPKPLAQWESPRGSHITLCWGQGGSRRVWEWFLSLTLLPWGWDSRVGALSVTAARPVLQDVGQEPQQGRGHSLPHLPNVPPREGVWGQPSG